MSPRAVIKRLRECGIEWFAITDHNSLANCPAYARVAAEEGIYFSWGVEIQSAEEIHILAYFDAPEQAILFDKELYDSLLPIANDPDFFGDQVIIDENENILRVEQRALINSSLWDLNTVVERIETFGGLAVPAHVDASVNSILSQLGFLPETPHFDLFGITAGLDVEIWTVKHPEFRAGKLLRASDAHYLSDIGKGSSQLYLDNPCVSEIKQAALGEPGYLIRV